jgi:PAS domain S-box-containing protein
MDWFNIFISSISVWHSKYELFWEVGIFFLFAAITFYVARLGSKEREQSQELRDILECTPNCIAVLNSELHCLRIAGSGIAFLGLDVAELLKKKFTDIWINVNPIKVSAQIRRAFLGERISLECDYKHPDGHMMHFFVFCGPLYSSDGVVDKVVTVWADITERKKLNMSLSRGSSQSAPHR